MYKKCFKKQLREFLQSKKALAIPVTYLILFASLIAIISVTYSFAIVKISARGALLKASVAKQNMQILDDAVRSVAWSFGASKVVYMDDCGGIFRTEPTAKNLVLNFTDEQTFYDIVFNSSVGKAFYELEPSEFNYEGFCIRGARADFTLTVQSIAANLAIDYAVNITTTIEINSSYTTLEGEEKLVNITCRVFNEAKPALAENITLFYENLGSWVPVNSSNNLSTVDYGNGTYLLSFTVSASSPVQVSTHVYDLRDIFVQANTTCYEA